MLLILSRVLLFYRSNRMKEIITIQISKFLTNELAEKIAQLQGDSSEPKWINRSRQDIFDNLVNKNECFDVIATTSRNEVVGNIHCVKNENDPLLWQYGNLCVASEYRRIGIAKQMIYTAINHLSEMGVKRLRCYVDPNNTPSRNLQESIGFSIKPFEKFNLFDNDGEIMYEIEIPSCLTVIPATVDEAYFVRIMFNYIKHALNVGNIRLSEWKEILAANDPDVKHFIVCKGAMPVAYMRLNGLVSGSEGFISMLFVAEDFQRQGIGTFAIKYAEEYLKEKGFKSIAVQTDIDNLSAQNCFLRCGYTIFEQSTKLYFRKML